MPDLDERDTSTNGNLEELQKLLLTVERDRLDRLEDRLKNSVVDTSAVAKVLPDAIRQRSSTKQDQHLEKSLERIIGKTFARAILESPAFIAEAISPVMMPAIQRAIKTTVLGMMQAMDKSLSWRGMTWHWEAWKTGKSFAEVALSHTMKYKVERVFLFFKENGVHLGDVHRPDIPPFESGHEDLISSMFSSIKTAVQKFAQDEFQASEQAAMEEFKIGDDLTVLIEQGPKAVLAAVVRGLPPPSLRSALKDKLDSLHFELNEALQNFRGDKKAFEAARPYLESCLNHKQSDSASETGSDRGGLSPALVVILMLPVIWLVWWGVTSYAEQQRWADFLGKASETPGIYITSTTASGKNGRAVVYGLRDPLSVDPKEIARRAGLAHEMIDFQFEDYLSLAPELIERRARDILHAPASVQLSVPKDTSVLNITGTAAHAWIAQLQKFGSMIPGVTLIQDVGLQDESRIRLDHLVREIEANKFEFEAGSASLSAESEPGLQAVLLMLREGDSLAQQLGNRIQVEIRGHTSEEGSIDMNHRLALARARGILSTLKVERFLATDLLPAADSVESSEAADIQKTKSTRARLVSFHVTVNDLRP